MIIHKELLLPAFPKGIHIITQQMKDHLSDFSGDGLLHIFICHTSAALSIGENADPDVRYDLNNILDKLIPESMNWYTHTSEGPDDMPSHAKTLLTGTSVTIPIRNGVLMLGTWQGIFLCEYRNAMMQRKLILTILS